MATQFKYDCPHCSTRNAGFRITVTWAVKGMGSDHRNIFAICGICDLGLLIHSRDLHLQHHADLMQKQHEFPGTRFLIVREWPRRALIVPADVPTGIGGFYIQGLENLAANRWDAAGAMFRKSLDVATKIVDPSSKSMILFKRIEKLYEDGSITAAMRDWSHEIRIDGNEAVHDEDPETREDAEASQKFTEAFLTYMFTLPSMVTANRAKRAELVAPAKAGA